MEPRSHLEEQGRRPGSDLDDRETGTTERRLVSQGSTPKKRAASKDDDEGGIVPVDPSTIAAVPGVRDAASGAYTVVA